MTAEPGNIKAASDARSLSDRRHLLASEFNTRQQQTHGEPIADSLSVGLATLRDLLYTRIQADVVSQLGFDSLIAPISQMQSEQQAKTEITLYQVAESTLMATSEEWVSEPRWYADWLARLCFDTDYMDPRLTARIAAYLRREDDQRRQAFVRVLQRASPDTARAPLILFRLMPLAIRIATAVAFGRIVEAAELRNGQLAWLPAIADCYACHGRPLDNGEQCSQCGNPLWKYHWLLATD